MASSTEICNLALSHLGVGKEIAALETERSQEASACRRFFDLARDEALRDFAWPFATKIIALGLVEEEPNDEWNYAYRYPTDCLNLRRILSGTRNDTRQTRVPHRIARDDSGRLIYTDTENAEAEYTILVDDPEQYPPDFTMALSLLIASYIAPRVTGGDPFKMGDRALRLYALSIEKARANSINEEQTEEHPESEFIRGRE